MLEQEEHERSVDHADEIAALQKEGAQLMAYLICRIRIWIQTGFGETVNLVR